MLKKKRNQWSQNKALFIHPNFCDKEQTMWIDV